MVVRPGEITNWDLMEEQIIFYRTHLDIFIEDAYKPFTLTRDQHVLVRMIGNCVDTKATCSRGFGKTLIAAISGFAICDLYPGTKVYCVSATAGQARLVLEKLHDLAYANPNIANEISATNAKTLVQLSKDSGKCTLKNGSSIESVAMDSARGLRGKMIIIDEALDVNQDKLEAIISPITNTTRQLCFDYKYPDFQSKTVTITSACEKSNQYFKNFLDDVRSMAKGDKTVFACSLDYNAAVANGITSMDFFMRQKKNMADLVFQMEYGAIFVGANANTAFPFNLVQACRTLEKIEMEQPKNSKSRYIIALDIATSKADNADNSVITVLKFVEKSDGSYSRKLVCIRSFHGEALDVLTEELRRLYHLKFPNTEKIIYDARGLGDSLDRFFDKEWVDPGSGREYPPLVVDDIPSVNAEARTVLHPFRAVNNLNKRIYMNLRVALEKGSIELPVSSKTIRAKQLEIEDPEKRLTMEEMAIFQETDALQIEMGNIVAKQGANSNIIYDVPRQNMHKDRYSSLAMGNDYISELEKENMRLYQRGPAYIGDASAW